MLPIARSSACAAGSPSPRLRAGAAAAAWTVRQPTNPGLPRAARFAAWRAAAAASKAAGGPRAARPGSDQDALGFFAAWVGRIVVRAAAGCSRRARKLWRARPLRRPPALDSVRGDGRRRNCDGRWRRRGASRRPRALAALGDALARARRRALARRRGLAPAAGGAGGRGGRRWRRRRGGEATSSFCARKGARRRGGDGRRGGRCSDGATSPQASEVREWRLERLVWRRPLCAFVA